MTLEELTTEIIESADSYLLDESPVTHNDVKELMQLCKNEGMLKVYKWSLDQDLLGDKVLSIW